MKPDLSQKYPTLTAAEAEQRERIAAINEAVAAKERQFPNLTHAEAFSVIRRERSDLFPNQQ